MTIEATFLHNDDNDLENYSYLSSSSPPSQPLNPPSSSPPSTSSSPSSSPTSLSLPHSILFAFNGATIQLPTLALMSIVNDRASISPAYLPAYGAVAFLPWSMKPVYAFLSSLCLNGCTKKHERHVLLAALLIASGASFVGTAFVPQNGVAICFIWAFSRGITTSWAEFLLGLTLIETARQRCRRRRRCCERTSMGEPSTLLCEDEYTNGERSEHDGQQMDHNDVLSSSNNNDDDGTNAPLLYPKYEELVSIFQSQAATCRNVGSLLASAVTFIVFLCRHLQKVETELSNAVVNALLFGTALLPMVGSAIAIKHKVGTFKLAAYRRTTEIDANDGSSSRCSASEEAEESCSTTSLGRTRQIKNQGGTYDGVATVELTIEEGGETDGENMSTTTFDNRRFKKRQEHSDVASLTLFQTLLILSAMQNPIVSATKKVVWISLVVLVGVGLVAALLCSLYFQKQKKKNDKNIPANSTTVPPRKLALYLILRHAMPTGGFLMSSYIYTIFASEPLFLQILSIVQTSVSALATYFYQKFFAQRYNAGWGMIGLIAVLTVIAAVVSLLDTILVHIANSSKGGGSDHVSAHLYWAALLIAIFTHFFSTISFMPSVVLASTNVVNNDDESHHRRRHHHEPSPSSSSLVYNEGMQYATFVSCIDFGDQAASWISVPIIASLGISRDNNWANLDRYIVICAVAKVVSVVFLWLLRPSPPNQRT